MDNYKIKVNDEAESKEAQELFFELGYSWLGCGKYYKRIGNYTFITAYPDEMLLRMGWGGDTDKELTLPQLRDLVVLKRNDVKDANCIDKKREAWYLASDGTYYAWQYRKLCWDTESDACVEAHDIKPINQPQDPALISGADALRALADGEEVLWRTKTNAEVKSFRKQTPDIDLVLSGDCNYRFWIKPRTIKLEIEIPAPFEPKVGDIYWFLSPFYSTGYDHCTFANDSSDKLHVQYGAYRSEDDVKKAVEQLRKIRGTNS